jgi:cytochrome o ubiquinol oxidase subunit II
MIKVFGIVVSALFLLGVALFAVFYIDTHTIDVLNPKGMIGLKERDLLITAASLMLIVIIPVYFLTILFSWRYRSGNTKAKYTPEWCSSVIYEAVWWGIPTIIIIVLATITWKSSHELNPFKPLESEKKPIVIQAVALDWKWLFIYPEHGIATVNYIQFPEQTPINFEITADAPMNSFWIPQLGGQIYAMPNMRSKLHLIANEIGTFRGAAANINGKGFAGMVFTAEASSEEDFEKWVKSVKQSPKKLNLDEYNRLAKPSEYVPVALYLLTQENLFDQIVMKYSTPPQE